MDTLQVINIPTRPGIKFSLRQPDVSEKKHAELLGVTFSNILLCDAHPEFVKAVFKELSKHFSSCELKNA